ncbi:Putative auto-transporter adhesin, head GIN domain [Prevotella sp. ne3005]|jgi:hypothetical protein|uniref:head GIN domain-containing protein n=1 Tax=Prevotella sp. ne3005 TaxID=1761887 RepID=UPI0008D8611C|nr:head GIN domain-containing protein [Prevotella sp. ne3005]SEM50894.1 Putative auto-transporter adhesin, head GIN domain [Prevotella sp. ne3005]
MKRKQFAIVGMMLLMGSATLVSCHNTAVISKDYVTEDRLIKGFEEVEVVGSPNVYYTQADSFSVRVKGPDNFVDNILTEKNGKTLTVRNKGKWGVVNISFSDEDELAVYVTSPDLVAVRVNGSGDFISTDLIDTDNMNITLRGSGDINIDKLLCDRCDVELIGSGDIDLPEVEAKETSAVLVGSGDIKMGLSKVADTRLSLKGSGDIKVDFSEGCRSVDCTVNGSGDIGLSGKIGHFRGEKHGSGDIDIANLTIEK